MAKSRISLTLDEDIITGLKNNADSRRLTLSAYLNNILSSQIGGEK